MFWIFEFRGQVVAFAISMWPAAYGCPAEPVEQAVDWARKRADSVFPSA